jgi:hypothetical protein
LHFNHQASGFEQFGWRFVACSLLGWEFWGWIPKVFMMILLLLKSCLLSHELYGWDPPEIRPIPLFSLLGYNTLNGRVRMDINDGGGAFV